MSNCVWAHLCDDDVRAMIVAAIAATNSMRKAAATTKVNFQTFKRHAIRLGLWSPNQGGIGIKKARAVTQQATSLDEILAGKHPTYGRGHLKARLLEAGLKKNECEECGLTVWRGRPITIQLEHINGERTDHRLKNLKMLCPNCHSQTMTFGGRNKKCSRGGMADAAGSGPVVP